MELSVVILNYNASAFLELCLESVMRATESIDAEVIVADNASVDDSLSMVAKKFPHVRIIAFQANYGFSRANNLAVKEARGKFLCILNPDTVVGEEVFVECLAFAKALPASSSQAGNNAGVAMDNLGFVGVQLIDGSGSFLPESKRHIPTPKVAREKMLGNDQHYYYNQTATDSRGKVAVLVGAFMFCKKAVYIDCGGFDERYFMYGEDIDLSYTALQKGYVNYYLGDQKIIHFKGESTVKNRDYLKRFYGAMELFYDKYFKRSLLEQYSLKVVIKMMIWLKSAPQTDRHASSFPAVAVTKDVLLCDGLSGFPVKELKNLDGQTPFKLIWDTKSYSFTELISFMKKYPSRYQYRFLNTDHTFFIGSDRSQDRGEIKKIH